MSDYVTLLGSEEVARAGYAMRDAATDMNRAAASIEDTLARQQMFLNDWLYRFEEVLKNNPQAKL